MEIKAMQEIKQDKQSSEGYSSVLFGFGLVLAFGGFVCLFVCLKDTLLDAIVSKVSLRR